MVERRLSSVPESALHWSWRLIGLVLIAALSYLAWRGYQQPELILDFANFRLC
jgi:hypothetical protein